MAANIKSWLRRLPQPSSVRFDKKQLVRVGEGKNKWRDVIDAVQLAQPRVLEALDSDGQLIRMTECTEAGHEDDEGTEAAKRNGPNTELAQLGSLLKEAYVDGARAHADAYQKLLAEHVKLMQLVVDRNMRLERQQDEEWSERAKQIEGGGDISDIMNGPLAPLISAVMGRMLESPKPKPKPQPSTLANGNGKRK